MEDQEPSYGHDLSGLNDLEQSLIDSLQSEFADFSNSDAIADAPKHKKRSRKRKKTPKNVTPSVVSNTNYPAVISHTLNDDDTEEPSTNLVPTNRKAQNSKYVKSFSGDNNLAKIGNSNIAVAKASSAGSANWRFGDGSNENATADGGFLATISNFMSKFNSGGSGSSALSGVSVASTQPTPLQRQFLMILMHMRDTLDDIKDLLSTDGGKSGVKGIGLPKAADTKAGGSSFWDDLLKGFETLLGAAGILLASKFGPIVKVMADAVKNIGGYLEDLGKDTQKVGGFFEDLTKGSMKKFEGGLETLNKSFGKVGRAFEDIVGFFAKFIPGIGETAKTAAAGAKTAVNIATGAAKPVSARLNTVKTAAEIAAETAANATTVASSNHLGGLLSGAAAQGSKFGLRASGGILKNVGRFAGAAGLYFTGSAVVHGMQAEDAWKHGKKWEAGADALDSLADAQFASVPGINFGKSPLEKIAGKLSSQLFTQVKRRLTGAALGAAVGTSTDEVTGPFGTAVGAITGFAAPLAINAAAHKGADWMRSKQADEDKLTKLSSHSALASVNASTAVSPNSSITNNHNNLTINFPNAVVQSFDQVKDYINKALQQYDSAQKQLNSNNERFGNLGLPTTGNTLPFSTSGGGFGG